MKEKGADHIGEIAAALYALEPDEFVPARDAHAAGLRTRGDRDLAARVKALRKPSLAAAAVNRLVRERPEDVAGLLEVGAALRRAQEDLAGDELRELTRQRQAAVAALTRAAAQLGVDAGRPLTDVVTRQVDATLTAAMADPDAAAAVRSGLLTAHLEYAGFGFGELADVVALPVRRAGGRSTRAARPNEASEAGAAEQQAAAERARQAVDTARRVADEARAAAATAARELAGAEDREAAATRARAEARARVAALAAELDEARAMEEAATRAETDAVRAHAVAERAAVAAELAATRANEVFRGLGAD